jgi:hypothetical protein
MKRRPPSLRRVVVEGHCPGFNGTTQTLRLPAARPAALRCLRLAVPPLRRCSLPLAAARRHRAWMLGHAATRCAAIGRWRKQDLPSSRTGPLAVPHMLLRPRTDRTELALALRCGAATGKGYGRGSVNGTFEAQSHGLAARCPRFAAPVARSRRRTRFRLRGYALPDGLRTRWACCEKFPRCVQFTSLSPFASLLGAIPCVPRVPEGWIAARHAPSPLMFERGG